MIRFTPAVRRRRLSLALGTSTLAWNVFSPAVAQAQCAPYPTQQNQTTICTGTSTDGVRLTSDGSTIQVDAAAMVTGSNTPAIAVDIPGQGNLYTSHTGTITIAGIVDGGSQSGINVASGTVSSGSYDFYGTQVGITVAAGAMVTGTSAVTLGPSAGNIYGPALASIDNSGTISGTGGAALLATDPARDGFISINNSASGSIGAISGPVGQLTNAGLVDGGALSAIDQTTTYNSGVYSFNDWTNSGTIRSSSTAATIANLGYQSLVNSGTIDNAGAGAAIQGVNLTITNLAGGRITTAGTTAIAAGSAIMLTNFGTITGDVVANPAQGTGFYSIIDSTAGTITGNLSLGRGNDLVYARYVGTPTLVTGISGTIDAGDGINSIVLAPTSDLTVSTAVTLPNGFQRLRLEPAENISLTLADGFVAPGTMELAGSGSIVNQTEITTTGQAFVQPYPYPSGIPSLINSGSIQATVDSGFYAIEFGNGASLTNAGLIGSSGNGVTADFGALSNTGSIIAAGTAVSQFDGQFDNQGLIRSTGGIGVSLSGNSYNTPATNSGQIEGATYGAVVDYVLNNSGTISASGSGTAVGLSSYGVLNNLAGGVISGGAYAITGEDPYGSTSVYNGMILNAGTINGDVTFVSPRSSGTNSNIYVALPGGILNGNLTLGTGDTLVMDLINAGSGSFAGINGTVFTNDSLLRYRVSGVANAVIGPVGPFATVGYELVNNAQLTLTAPAAQTLPIILAGNGTVDLSANASVTNQPALSVVAATALPDAPADGAGLTIINHGTLAGTIDDYFAGAFGVVTLASNTSLDNEGVIKAAFSATNGGQSYNAAVAYGGSLINNGRIELDGSYGAYDVATVTNAGAIVQTGPGASIGISGASTVTNSGTIQTAGVAIQGGYAHITNSGTIASTGDSAIGGMSDSVVTNLASGTISGGAGTAIAMSGGSVVNAGRIVGNVDLSGFFGNGSAYYSDGGTLTGNLILGSGDDLFLQGGDSTGVSGTIDAGGGRNVYGRALTASGTIAIGPAPGTGFQDALVAAFGSGTDATLTGVDASFQNLYAVGDGTVVNQAALTGAVITAPPIDSMWGGVVGSDPLGAFSNTGSIAGGLSGSVSQLINTGVIGSSDLTDSPLSIANQGAGALSVTNSGQIMGSETAGQSAYLSATDSLTLSNSGSIDTGLVADVGYANQSAGGTLSAINSGTISNASSGAALSLSATAFANSAGGSVFIDNSGTLSANGSGDAAGLALSLDGTAAAIGYAIQNRGSISAATSATNGGASVVGLGVSGLGTVSGTIANSAAGAITASGPNAVALQASGTAIILDNAGAITASGTGALAIKAVDGFANTIHNTGTITGSILLGSGSDTVENRGTIIGDVTLGAGDDSFLEQASATITGTVDGGDGTDTLIIDATGGGTVNGDQFVNFERFNQIGSGNVTYAGDFKLNTIGVSSGTITVAAGQTLSSGSTTTITGSDAAETVLNNGTIAGSVALAGGNDRFVNNGAIMGSVSLGDGDDQFVEGVGGSVAGSVDGGAGNDTATIELAGNRSLAAGKLIGFETLTTEGSGQLSLDGTQSFTTVLTDADLAIAADGALTVETVQFGSGNNHFSIAGGFTGSIDGGAGTDTLSVSGGSEASPIVFNGISNVEAYNQTGGFARIYGTAAFDTLAVNGGRLVGQAGSVISAPQILVGQGATFGSAGTVNGNVAIAGTLSPGASPGTMTVNGNVTLASGSTSLFELSSTVSDKLVVSGSISIATGATLQLVEVGTLRPGASYSLISAGGGITGSYSTILKPADLFGIIVQRADEIDLLGEFIDDGRSGKQVSGSIAYANATLVKQSSTSTLFDALPALLTATGASSPQAFARLTPEPYASATQMATDNALALVNAARGPAFAASDDTPHVYSIATTLGQWKRLDGDAGAGTSAADTRSYGFLGGLGFGDADWSVSAFGGYLNSRQSIDMLAAHTRANGAVGGVQGRFHTSSGFGFSASIFYDGSGAVTKRTLPVGTATGRYDLHNWVGDAMASYEIGLSGGWALQPQLGLTYVRTTRGGATEQGGSPFALTVARDRHVAGFGDGFLRLGRSELSAAPFRPFVSFGVRYQIEGRRTDALAGYAGGGLGLDALGAQRSKMVGSVAGGVDYRFSNGLDIFATAGSQTGSDDHQESASAGVRLRF